MSHVIRNTCVCLTMIYAPSRDSNSQSYCFLTIFGHDFFRENIMKLSNKIFSVITLSVLSQSVTAIPFALEGRSLAMGGVSVATADLATAAWANPAMLTNQRPGDQFSLLIGGGALLRDDDDLIIDIDNFQAADNRRNIAIRAGDATGEIQAIS